MWTDGRKIEPVEICPGCGANRAALRWMLAEPSVMVQMADGQKVAMPSEKYTLAGERILKCPACREALAGELRICPRCHGQILGVGDEADCLQCGFIPRSAPLPYQEEKWKHRDYLR